MTNCNHSLFSDVFYSSQLGFLVGKKSYGEGGEGGGISLHEYVEENLPPPLFYDRT